MNKGICPSLSSCHGWCLNCGEPMAMRAAMEDARLTVDALEAVVAADLWPVPTYAQMLNIHSK